MSLRGALATMPLPDLLQWLSDALKHGTLTVAIDFEERAVRLEGGNIVAMVFDDPLQRELGRVLMSRDLIDEIALSRGLERAAHAQRPLDQVLVSEGLIAQETLSETITDHVRQTVMGMFIWREGTFVFSDESSLLSEELRPPEYRLPEPILTRELLMEGLWRVDEWQRIAAIFSSEYMQVLALGDDGQSAVVRFLKDLGEPVALCELALMRPESRYEIYQELYRAHRKGLVAIDAKVYEVATPVGHSPVDVLVESARVLLDEQQYDEAMALLRAAENLHPYRVDVHTLVRRAHDEHLAALYRELPQDHLPVVVSRRGQGPEKQLAPRERYLLSRINGQRDVGMLAVMTPLGELPTLKLLAKLRQLGFLRLEPGT